MPVYLGEHAPPLRMLDSSVADPHLIHMPSKETKDCKTG